MKALLALALLLPQSVPAPHDDRLAVEAAREGGELLLSVSCDNAPLYDVLRAIGERADADVDGFRDEWRKQLVTVDLRRRPLRQVLAYVLGSVDLAADVRQGAVFVHPVEHSDDPAVLREFALAAYQRALREFPEHQLVPQAEQRLAEIEEQRGDRAAARARYALLVERHPDSEIAPAAMMRLGELLASDRDWDAAAVRFEDLLRYARPHPYQLAARTELLRCLAHGGHFDRALNLVDDLDLASPAKTLETSVDRRLLRARCLAGLGRGAQALDVLADIAQSTLGEAERVDYLETRAVAGEAAGQADQAARSWLSYSREVQGAERRRGLEHAARLALAGGDALGVLFVEAQARRDGVESPALASAAREARTQLSLESESTDAAALLQRVERGERLLAAGLRADAFDLLRRVAPLAGALEPAERTRFALAYARCLAGEVNVDAALGLLRETLPFVSAPELRRSVYVLAGELLEEHQRLDEAIEAYRGKL